MTEQLKKALQEAIHALAKAEMKAAFEPSPIFAAVVGEALGSTRFRLQDILDEEDVFDKIDLRLQDQNLQKKILR